jgi:ketosteroid isomerase-like protein
MYKAIDAKDPIGMCNFLTEDSSFTFANMPAVVGKSNIINFLDGFFQSIKGLRHTNIEYRNYGDEWFANGTVTYTRLNESTLQVPFAVLLKMHSNLIQDYRIYVDASELYK